MRDWFAPIVRHVIAPAWAIKEKSPYLKHLRIVERTQFLSEEELRDRQWPKLKKILNHAYDNCPFYGRFYDDHGVHPSHIRSWADFSRLPKLSKKDIRANMQDMVARNVPRDKLVPGKTSGSTGVSVFFYVDEASQQFKRACTVRHNRWAGWDIGERVGAIWGNPPTNRGFRLRMRTCVLDRHTFLDTLRMDENDMRLFAREMIARPPAILFGHAHSLYLFALYVRARGFRGISPRGIISTAMVLLDNERATIESVFRSKVFNRYGCEEVALIASECEAHSGLHINMDTLVVEVLSGDRHAEAGEVGEIVVTDLTNYGMPFIRYRVGDMGVRLDERCSCGRGLPLLARVEGRTADYVITPHGDFISGISLTENLATLIPGLEQIQIIQEKRDFLRFRVVRGQGFNDKSMEVMKAMVLKRFGPEMQYECEFVDRISQEPSGKYRFVISQVELPFN
jgi:phenylacetate-CoA ligase